MSINPIKFARQVNQQFIRYQLTAFPIADTDLSSQVKQMLAEPLSSDSPLFKGPYLSLSRPFAEGASLTSLANQHILHPALTGIFQFSTLFAHQEKSLHTILHNQHCLITTGTGSGKTEAFLIPILDYCLRLRDANAPAGVVCILVYPMNALASDQLGRLRVLLAGTDVSFGMYIGSTPQTTSDVTDIVRMNQGESRDKYDDYYQQYQDHKGITIAPWEERISRDEIINNPPRILITNPSQLEFMITRGKDIDIFLNAPLKFLVLDEAHTYTGAIGAEVACLVRRVRSFCGKSADDVVCIATSATITDPSSSEFAGKQFMQRLFGIDTNKVEVIGEEYTSLTWPSFSVVPPSLGASAPALFEQLLTALDSDSPELLAPLVSQLTSLTIQFDQSKPWTKTLYDFLKSNQVVKIIHEELTEPTHLVDATRLVFSKLGRVIDNIEYATYELLCYLALGAAAEDNGSLLRPKIHYFVRGLRTASVVLFKSTTTDADTSAEIFFSPDRAIAKYSDHDPRAIHPVLVCTNCGQHYFEIFLEGVEPETETLSGGFSEGTNVVFPACDKETGTRFLFTNHFVSEDLEGIDNGDRYTEKLDKKRIECYVCRFCGSIHLHPDSACRYNQCSRNEPLLKIFVLIPPREVSSCPSCSHRGPGFGERYREPFRPLRAVTVADIHILAQELLNNQPPKQRKLIVFADNRQDAAFQAAWMAQRARRYRLLHIIYDILHNFQEPISIGRLLDKIIEIFDKDPTLARVLAPEVYSQEEEESYSSKLKETLRHYLRLIVLQEITTTLRSKVSLESWGLLTITYYGLDDPSTIEYLTKFASSYKLSLGDVQAVIKNLLDLWRRGRLLYDTKTETYTHYWHASMTDIQRGFLPSSLASFPPKGLKLLREKSDKNELVTGIYSSRGQTTAQSLLRKLNLSSDESSNFLTAIWELLTTKLKILVPVTLKSTKGTPIGGAIGVYQISTEQIGLLAQNELYRCNLCLRVHTRATPNNKCTSLYCSGSVIKELPSEDNYDISLLKRSFTMLMAKEHTAQVPAKDREKIEDEFKKTDEGTNCIVSTPTLELGVDIGSLDVVLMRNVPPLPSNYWQRAGRAGRRYRMAVIYTYCRKNIHDDYFFEDPTRLLKEKIQSPKFNLKNAVMIKKHVHAINISHLFALSEKQNLNPVEAQLTSQLPEVLPTFIDRLLFGEEGTGKRSGRPYKREPVNLASFNEQYNVFSDILLPKVLETFQDYWPEEAKAEVTTEVLSGYTKNFVTELQVHYNLLHKQLLWTIQTRNRIWDKGKDIGTLDEVDKRILARCHNWIKNIQTPDLDNYTLSVLSRLGFLPVYGRESGNITAFANTAYSNTWQKMTFELNRPSTIALYEFAPGNLIYANGGKYRTYFLHLGIEGSETEPDKKTVIEPDKYVLDLSTNRILEHGMPIDGYVADTLHTIEGIPFCDVDITFLSHVSDEENYRFRMPTSIVGYRKKQHRGGTIWHAGNLEIHHIKGQSIRLVNVGPADKIDAGEFGYPICLVCGATRSPYASEKELENFKKNHLEKFCKVAPSNYSLTADVEVDGLLFKNFLHLADAINFGESIRIGASVLLEMNREDLQVLALPQSLESFDIILYDPMPGGSGLLDQIIEQWGEICKVALEALDCQNQCLQSCYRCLRTFGNMPFHKIFDRRKASALVTGFSEKLRFGNEFPPARIEERPVGFSTNRPEYRLRQILTEHGFPNFVAQQRLNINAGSIKSTVPDLYYKDTATGKELAIYLDGLSKSIHGNTDRQYIDQLIRITLKNMGLEVVEITASMLDDPMMLDLKLQEINLALKRITNI